MNYSNLYKLLVKSQDEPGVICRVIMDDFCQLRNWLGYRKMDNFHVLWCKEIEFCEDDTSVI